jgi:hypothetical protein
MHNKTRTEIYSENHANQKLKLNYITYAKFVISNKRPAKILAIVARTEFSAGDCEDKLRLKYLPQ